MQFHLHLLDSISNGNCLDAFGVKNIGIQSIEWVSNRRQSFKLASLAGCLLHFLFDCVGEGHLDQVLLYLHLQGCCEIVHCPVLLRTYIFSDVPIRFHVVNDGLLVVRGVLGCLCLAKFYIEHPFHFDLIIRQLHHHSLLLGTCHCAKTVSQLGVVWHLVSFLHLLFLQRGQLFVSFERFRLVLRHIEVSVIAHNLFDLFSTIACVGNRKLHVVVRVIILVGRTSNSSPEPVQEGLCLLRKDAGRVFLGLCIVY